MTPDDPLLAALEALPRELPPESDLWPGLAAQLTPRRPSPQPTEAPGWWGLSAAAAILVIAVGAGQLAPRPPAPGRDGAALLQAGAEQLEGVLAEQRGEMDPELYLIVTRSLDDIDEAVGRIEAALAGDPDDPRLQDALESLQRRRVALLRTAVNL